MNYEDTNIGTVFIAPASYLIEELEEQEKEIFKNSALEQNVKTQIQHSAASFRSGCPQWTPAAE